MSYAQKLVVNEVNKNRGKTPQTSPNDWSGRVREARGTGPGVTGGGWGFSPANVIAGGAKTAATAAGNPLGSGPAPAAPQAPPGAQNPYGSQSGPGILESWFNQRATGTDPAFEYASKRGMETLGNRYSAAGAFNSGAARQGESDFMANLVAQRMGQLDSLAGGASGEHMGRLGMMFGQGLGIAGGEAGLSSAYDLGAAGNMAAANEAQRGMALQKAGVDSQANQALVNNAMNIYGLSRIGGSRGGGGVNPYDPDGLMAPSF